MQKMPYDEAKEGEVKAPNYAPRLETRPPVGPSVVRVPTILAVD